ncbi:uncharacterized protein LOC123004646 isoform X2 [Tribolium madens]|uniref:uncharacterized protein LOC123004646 isoform X2 n=1 Tax=Tribolium madens TaxID=41895 RepID=UPI001CF74477|nr:uncharacterized protein LOC123004646 isoform X2 [Tribolium madens]
MDGDLIEKLLQTSGLSCEDLLVKLQQYKLMQSSKLEKKQEESIIHEENVPEEQQCTRNTDNSVILETQSCTVDSSSSANDSTNDTQVVISLKENIKEIAHKPVEEKLLADYQNDNSCDSSFVQKIKGAESFEESAEKRGFKDIKSISVVEDEKENEYGEESVEKLVEKKYEANDQNNDSCNVSVVEGEKKNECSEESVGKLIEEKHETSEQNNDTDKSTVLQNLSKVESNEEIVVKSLEVEPETDDMDKTSCSKEMSEEIMENQVEEETIRENIVERLLRKTSATSRKDNCEEIGKKPVDEGSKTDKGANEKISENTCKDDTKMFSEDSSNSADIHNYSDFINSLEEEDSASCASVLSKSTLDTSETVTSVQPEMSVSEVLPTSEEQLRDVLKMQLSSLRNMKKSSGYLPDFNRRSIFFHNLKKKRKSCDVKTIKPVTETENNEEEGKKHEENSNKVDTINDDSLVSLSDQTDFVIVDVTGGIDRLTPEINETGNKEDIEERCFAAVSSNGNEDVPIESSKDMSELTNVNNIEDATKNYSPSKEIRNLLTNYRRKMSLNYFDANFSTLKGQDKFKTIVKGQDQHQNLSTEDINPHQIQGKLVQISVKKNISENFDEDPGINKSVKNNEKSPFVSDSLEDFLNESSQLKISYSIPKLGAEEGINESTKEISPFDSMVKVQKIEPVIEKETPQREPKLIKAKTLADMRRQFEKLNAKEAKKREKETKSESPKISSYRNSHIIYNNKKLWVTTKTNTSCAGVINSSDGKDHLSAVSNKKPSLLSTLHQRKRRSVSYKPGPLSKKFKLQDTYSRDKWTTELKVLPKIYLEVTPEFKKAIDPEVVHLMPIFDDCVITEERTNFALTALKLDDEPKSYTFPISYKNNQTQITVRKRVEPILTNSEVGDSDPEKVIASVLSDLISYVEVKEIEDTLIKDDDIVLEDPEPITEVTPKSRGRRIKRNKVDLELLRLSCKVIDVATNETENKPCSKSFCKMGCVCRSLLCESVFSDHCQLVDCMFGCKCPPTTSDTSSNSLPAHTVNHLEDKAKKNLAKVEREFTQTVIHTDNDTILVGTGKVRRCTKTPKKYTDYIGDVDDIVIKPAIDVETKKPLRVKNCSVVLERLNLGNIKPLCLYHRLYDCDRCASRLPYVDKPYCFRHRIFNCSCNKDREVKQPNYKIINQKPAESCARIRRVFSQYKERNKDPLYNAKLRRKNQQKFRPDLEQIIKDAIKVTSEPKQYEGKKPSKRKQSFVVREDEPVLYPRKETFSPKVSPCLDNQVDKDREMQIVSPGNEFQIRRPDKEFALQRRKKKKFVIDTHFQKASADYGIFDGEIKLSLKENQNMLPFVHNQASLEYLRILPWTNLIKNFQDRKMLIWAKENGATILCNAVGYLPPKNFVNIRRLKNKSEFITWIVTNHLPNHIPRNLMHVILSPRKNHYMISGYCLKKAEDINATSVNLNLENSQIPKLETAQPSTSFENLLTNVESRETTTSKTDDITLNSLLKDHSTFKFSRLYKSVLLKPKPSPEKRPNSVVLENKNSGIVKLKTSTTSIKPVSGGAIEVNVLPLPKCPSQRDSETIEIDCGSNPEAQDNSQDGFVRQTSDTYELDEVTSQVKETSQLPNKLSENTNSSSTHALLPERTLKCTHKDMHNHKKTIVLTHKELVKRRVYLENDALGSEMVLPLPRVQKSCRWRMIYLNSDFSYLNFTKSNYSIKYTDLLDVVKMASTVGSTIILRNQEIRQFYKNFMFGIFCVPDYQDRIFVGPYFQSEKHNIETLRYLQGKLIDTETFNKIIGKKVNEKGPVWVYEVLCPNSLPDGLVIDITEDDEVPMTNEGVDVLLEPLSNSLFCPPFVKELNEEELKLKHSFNRYIITNIPYLGYFGACQRDSKEIEVFWPNNTRGYRFPNVTLAKNLLIHYLSQIFCPIPQSFKINVIIMTHLDLKTNTPVNSRYLTEPGPFFCGEFGIYDKGNVPEDLLQECNVPSLDSLLKTYKKFLEDDESIIKLFGLFLMSNEELRKFPEPQQILQRVLRFMSKRNFLIIMTRKKMI